MSTREEVFKTINEERDYQDSLWKDNLDETNTTADYLIYMKNYLDEAFRLNGFTSPKGETSRDFIRKVIAIGVKALEVGGAPQRKVFRSANNS